VLQKRLLQAIEADHDAHIEQTEAERIAWEAEQERIAEEEAEKEAALAHLTKVNSKFAALKAPALRKQLAKRGLKTTGKKAQLLERLANALEVEYAGKREQAKRIAAEEARIAEIAAQQDAADVEYRQLVKDIKKMKKPALMKELKQRELDVKGKQDELSTRLLGAVEADKDAADEERRDAAMSEEEKLSREVAEREASEEAERLEAEEAMAEQLALEEEAERVAAEDAEAVIGECVMFCVTHCWKW
jgi:fused signal recognition particle receptor